jgi:hypothetical protein
MRRNKIVSTSSGIPPESLMQMTPRLLSIDFCASLHGSAKDRQVMLTAVACFPTCNLYTRHLYSGMKTDRIRTDITDIIFVFIFISGFGFEYG